MHHFEHLPRGVLGSLVVLVEFIRHMAIAAFHTQRLREKLHGAHKPRRRHALHHLNVLVDFLRWLGWLLVLCKRARRAQHHGNGELFVAHSKRIVTATACRAKQFGMETVSAVMGRCLVGLGGS